MSSITISDVQKLAALSALTLSDEEAESLAPELERILTYIDQLGEVDTTDVAPTYQVVDLANVYRQDSVVGDVAPDELIKGVPKSKDQQILVPKVL